MKRLVFTIIVLLLIVPAVHSLVISARKTIDFAPNLEYIGDVCVTNTLGEARHVVFSLHAPLAEYAEFDMTPITLQPSSRECRQYILRLPAAMDTPGKNYFQIEAVDAPVVESGIFIIKQSVIHELVVEVPYPGKFIRVTQDAQSINTGMPTNINFVVTSFGMETIDRVEANVNIINWLNNTISVVFPNPILNLAPRDSQTIEIRQPTTGWTSGLYRYNATIQYDGGEDIPLAGSFFVGELDVNILRATRNLTKGKINKVEIEVESEWASPLGGVYAKIGIPSLGVDERSLPDEISFHKPATFIVYVDATEIGLGVYPATITLNIDGRDKVISHEFEVMDVPTSAANEIPEEVTGNGPLLAVWLPLILIVLVVLLMVFLQKRHKTE